MGVAPNCRHRHYEPRLRCGSRQPACEQDLRRHGEGASIRRDPAAASSRRFPLPPPDTAAHPDAPAERQGRRLSIHRPEKPMKCPTCDNVNLAMTDRQGIEIDYCPQCRGIWLDRGELDRLIERAEQAAPAMPPAMPPRSEEHTSELQSLMRIPYAV